MARVTFSPLIAGMRGKTAGVVFSVWKGIAYVRSWVIPSNPQSDDQTAQRNALKHTLTCWQSIKSWAKRVWDPYGTAYQMSGYNSYIRRNIKAVKAGIAGLITPYNADYIKIGTMAIAGSGADAVTCTWVNSTGVSDKDWVTACYRKTETLKEEYAWTVTEDTDVTLETLTIEGLDAAEEYEVAMFCGDGSPGGTQEGFNKILVAGA